MHKKEEWGNIPMKGEQYAELTIKKLAQIEAGLESSINGQLAKARKGNGKKAKESGQLLLAAKKGGEAMRDSGKLAKIRSLPKKLPYTTTKIYSISKQSKKIKKYKSQQEAARVLNLPVGNINKVLTGGRKSVGGYYFHYNK